MMEEGFLATIVLHMLAVH